MTGPALSPSASLSAPMTDPFGRTISYLRVSVTDRCDLRCFYCMSEDMTFLPKADLLTLDELDPAKFRAITRWGDLNKVLSGIEAARSAGLAVKINAVALKNLNEDEIPSLMEWAHGKGMALTLIEVMPMGEIGEGRIDQYVPLSLLRARLAHEFTL